MDINSFTVLSLKKGDYDQDLPELVKLKQVIENNLWHDHQTVFDHTVRVLEELEAILKRFEHLVDLQQIISQHSRKTLLVVATLLHDMAKIDVIVSDESGMTQSPGHELLSSIRVKQFASRFMMDAKEVDHVSRVVHFHGFVSEIINQMMANGDVAKWEEILQEVVENIEMELLLFILSDVKGSDLSTFMPDNYIRRVEIIESLIKQKYGPQ